MNILVGICTENMAAVMKEKIKANQTLAELVIGILCFGVICQIVGIFLAHDQLAYAVSLWIGIIAAVGMVFHMNHTINKALSCDEGTAEKMTRSSYFLRYGCAMVLLGVAAATGLTNLIVMFLGIMGLKIGAYLQPFMHKLLQKLIQ